MQLKEILKKVNLNGRIDVVKLNENGYISAQDISGNIFIYLRPKEFSFKIKEPIGIRGISTILQVLPDDEEISASEKTITFLSGSINWEFRLADLSSVVVVPEPKKVIASLKEKTVIKIRMPKDFPSLYKSAFKVLRPEMISFTVSENKKITCTVGESISHTATIELGTATIEGKIKNGFTIQCYGEILHGVLDSLKDDSFVVFRLGKSVPILIYEKADDCEINWSLAPYETT